MTDISDKSTSSGNSGPSANYSKASDPEPSGASGARTDFLDLDDYYMTVACVTARRSKDPSRQVGAVIVNKAKRIVGLGYNGMPNRCGNDTFPWTKDNKDRFETKYAYVCHAELNAIMNKFAADVSDCDMYTTLFPCNECAKIIIQSGIRRVFYLHDKPNQPEFDTSKEMLKLAEVEYQHINRSETKWKSTFRNLKAASSSVYSLYIMVSKTRAPKPRHIIYM